MSMADFKQSREVNWTITVKNEGTEETTTYSVNGKRSVADCLREALALEEHPKITKKAGELTVKLDVDASDAIRALKALQREARKATQALRELEVEAEKQAKDQTVNITVNIFTEPGSDIDVDKIAEDISEKLRKASELYDFD
jgi:hypothetical protein